MKRLLPLILLGLMACAQNEEKSAETPADGAAAGAADGAATGGLQTEDDKTFYALGLSIGESVGIFNLTPAELEIVLTGIKDKVGGQPPKVDLDTYGPKLNALAQLRAGSAASAEEKACEPMLAAAAAVPGAETTASGLIYQPVTEGTGASPTAADVVKVHYRGTLRDGTEFDSSYKRNEPISFPLGGVIPCWTEGVQKMKIGGKAKLICPAKIAYGDRGSPPVIPGGAALTFEIELLDVEVGAGAAAMSMGHP